LGEKTAAQVLQIEFFKCTRDNAGTVSHIEPILHS